MVLRWVGQWAYCWVGRMDVTTAVTTELLMDELMDRRWVDLKAAMMAAWRVDL